MNSIKSKVNDDSKLLLLKEDNDMTSKNGSLNVIRVRSTVNTLEVGIIAHSKTSASHL